LIFRKVQACKTLSERNAPPVSWAASRNTPAPPSACTALVALGRFNRYNPQFAVSLISDDAVRQERFYNAVNAPFVGNGITRRVDG